MTNRNALYVFFVVIFSFNTNYSQSYNQKLISQNLIYDSQALSDSSLWNVEQMPGGKVKFKNGTIEIFDKAGCTVWFKNILKSPVQIEYKITVIDSGGVYDRVSDMNVFWMASHPEYKYDLFNPKYKRSGKLQVYDSFYLYYVGFGGHNNTRTRFRRYNGTTQKPLLPQHDLTSPDVLLEGNKTYTVQLVADSSTVQYICDGKIIYDINDPQPYTKGYFGFRTFTSHQIISGFKVYKLTN